MLSPRQKEILEFSREGYAAKQIANKLGNSEQTIKVTLQLIRARLGAKNTTQAVVIAIRKGYIDLRETS